MFLRGLVLWTCQETEIAINRLHMEHDELLQLPNKQRIIPHVPFMQSLSASEYQAYTNVIQTYEECRKKANLLEHNMIQ